MVVSYYATRSHEISWSMVHVVFISRPTGKIQIHWEQQCLYVQTNTSSSHIKNESTIFINIFINILKYNKTMASKENHMIDICMRMDLIVVTSDASPLSCGLWSQLMESFLTHLSITWFFVLVLIIWSPRNILPDPLRHVGNKTTD